MIIAKREYLLRGGIGHDIVTDEKLYLMKVSLNKVRPDLYDFLKKRVSIYKRLGFSEPNAYQRYWMYQRYRGGSVITIGPVGIGKTTFALVETLLSEGKAIVIVPTKALAKTVYEKLLSMEDSVQTGKTILIYDKKTKDDIISGDFEIGVMTFQAFRIIYDQIEWKSSLSVVDDVDAFVKNPRNLDRLLDVTMGSIILSSATFKASPRQKRRLVEEFGISFRTSRFVGYRNVEDIYGLYDGVDSMYNDIIQFVQFMGPGGIIFLPKGTDENSVVELLNQSGIRAAIGSPESLNDMVNGKIDVLVGKAAFYGVLVRGIDLPTTIRYTVFAGVPKGEIILRRDQDISKWWSTFVGGNVPNSFQEIVQKLQEIADKRSWSISVFPEEIHITYPDITTYIQASGRTSRFTGKGFTFGLSFVAETDEHLLMAFVRKASLYGITFVTKHEVDLVKLKEKVDTSRSRDNIEEVPFHSYLMLVESPHKVETIASLLGGGVFRYIKISDNFIIRVAEVSFGTTLIIIGATVGHTSDIVEIPPQDWRYDVFYGVSVEKDGFYPIMDTLKMADDGRQVVSRELIPPGVSYKDKLDVINVYREVALSVDGLIIATDPDSEGERIAYEVGAYLAPYSNVIHRVEFREITRNAIINALSHMRSIDTRRVEAALVRRIEDRWVGFFLSEKVSNHFDRKGLSGGRVQTPVLGWIIDRYKMASKRKIVYKVGFPFSKDFSLEVEDTPPSELDIVKVDIFEKEKSPLSPYSTDLMLADASRILKFTAAHTMKLAQDLFSGGFITYHRTDSVRVSEDGIRIAKFYIVEKYGADLFHGRRWDIETSEHMQGAHECIRPTRPIDGNELWDMLKVRNTYTWDHIRLYNLIFRRFMASQATSAILRYISVVFNRWLQVEFPYEILKEGYIVFYKDVKVYSLEYMPRTGYIVPNVMKTEKPLAWPMKEEEVIRYMKEKGIGRPSTYGKILETIKKHGYVRVSPKGFLIPTDIGIAVYGYLREHFEKFVLPARTSLLYRKMDMVEEGKHGYMDILWEVYKEIKDYM